MSAGYARTTVLVAALFLGLATATLVYIYAFQRRAPGPEMRAVVAAAYIAADTVISPDMIREVSLPASQLEKDALTSAARAAGMVTRTPFNEGEQITLSRITDRAAAFGLPGLIPPGTRAMSITVESSDAVSGFIKPGDKVDIVASFAQGSDSVARTILQDVPLLAVNGALTAQVTPAAAPPAGEKPKPGPAETTTSVTIAVTPAQAERLVAAQYKGKLKLGLRGLNDASRVVTAGSSLNQMLGIPQEPRMGVPGAAASKAEGARVTVKRATGRKAPHRPGAGDKEVAAVLPVLPAIPGAGPGQATVKVIRGTQVEEVPVSQ